MFMLLLGMGLGASAFVTYDQYRNGNLQKMYNNMKFKKGMPNTPVNKSL